MFLKKYLYIFLFISFCIASNEEENQKDRKMLENYQKPINFSQRAKNRFLYFLRIANGDLTTQFPYQDFTFPESYNPNEPSTSTLLSSSNTNHERRSLLISKDADKIHLKTITDENISTNKNADKVKKLSESNTNPKITNESTSSSSGSSETDESTSSSSSSSETDESTSSSTSSSETNIGPRYFTSPSETNESTSSSTSSSETNESPRVFNFFEDIDEIGDIILARIERDKQREAAKGQENSEELLKNIPAEREIRMRGECSIQ